MADWDVRLHSGDPALGVGVDVFYGGQWYSVCGDSFWDNDNGAKLVCQKVGFGSGWVAYENDVTIPIPPEKGPRWDYAMTYILPSQGMWLDRAPRAEGPDVSTMAEPWTLPPVSDTMIKYPPCAEGKMKGVKVVCK
jgi:hypothetical protein